MANTHNNIKDVGGIIAKAAAQTLKDNLVFCSKIDMADPSDFDGKNGYKAGDTIYTSKPARYVPQTTFDITSSIQDSVEESAALTLDTISTVGIEANTTEFATEVELKSYIKRFVVPAAESIAQDVEQRFIEKATDATYFSVGTAGSNTFAVSDILAARTKLNEALAPRADRSLLMTSSAGADAINARKGLFQDASGIAEQYREGMIGRADGFDWYENELLNVHTNGNDVAFEVRTTSTEGDSTLVVEGLTTTTGTVKKGTVFTIATVNKVHPITKVDTGELMQFVVTADATADGSGYATLSISPSIYAGSNGLQNVSALPADGDAITPVGAASTAYTQNLAFHKNAFKMVSVPLVMPTNAEFAATETVDGITVSVVRDWDNLERKMVTRLDFLGGLSAVRPEWACRVTA